MIDAFADPEVQGVTCCRPIGPRSRSMTGLTKGNWFEDPSYGGRSGPDGPIIRPAGRVGG